MATPCNKSKDPAVPTSRLVRASKMASVSRGRHIRGSRSVRRISQNSLNSVTDQPPTHHGVMDSPDTDTSPELTKTGRIKRAKKGKKVHNCLKCQKIYSRNEHLQRHMASHKPSQHDCAKCLKKFSRPDLLTRHQKETKSNPCRSSLARAHSASAALKSEDSSEANHITTLPTQPTNAYSRQEGEAEIKEEEKTMASYPHAIMTGHPNGMERLSSEEPSSASDTAQDNYTWQLNLHHTHPQHGYLDQEAFHNNGTPFTVYSGSNIPDYFGLSTSPYPGAASLATNPIGLSAEPRQLPLTPANDCDAINPTRLHVAGTSPPYNPRSTYNSGYNTPQTGPYSQPSTPYYLELPEHLRNGHQPR